MKEEILVVFVAGLLRHHVTDNKRCKCTVLLLYKYRIVQYFIVNNVKLIMLIFIVYNNIIRSRIYDVSVRFNQLLAGNKWIQQRL